LKAAAAAGMALLLVPLLRGYDALSERVGRAPLLGATTVGFAGCLVVFGALANAWHGSAPLAVAFFVFVGIFNVFVIAQFWSFANDVYSREEGDRLFPLIAVGSTAGAPLGAAAAQSLFARGVSPWAMMQIAAGLLVLHLVLYTRVWSRPSQSAADAKPSKSGGFSLVLSDPYLRLVALLLVLLNIVNSTGEFILARLVTERAAELAAASAEFNRGAFIGQFYGSYFFWVNVASVVLQAFLVSRVVKRFGFKGALLTLPILACGAYGLAALGAGLTAVRIIKTAENSADYSMMNTAKQMLWLPTTREQKFKAKQASDTFFVRTGDLLSAAVVFVGTHYATLGPGGFAITNVVIVTLALLVAFRLAAAYARLTKQPAQA
jgi:AAA family ATP:ADP antiporter